MHKTCWLVLICVTIITYGQDHLISIDDSQEHSYDTIYNQKLPHFEKESTYFSNYMQNNTSNFTSSFSEKAHKLHQCCTDSCCIGCCVCTVCAARTCDPTGQCGIASFVQGFWKGFVAENIAKKTVKRSILAECDNIRVSY